MTPAHCSPREPETLRDYLAFAVRSFFGPRRRPASDHERSTDNTVEVHSTSELHAMLRAARKDGRGMAALIGFGAGAVLAIGVALIVGISLDLWRVKNHDRLVAEAAAKYGECTALWNETQPESYSSAINTRRQIVALRGERR